MGADEHIDLAALDGGQGVLLLLGGLEPRQGFDTERVVGQTLAESPFVLLGQDRGGDEDRDLLAELDALERAAESDLGFAEAHIAADQAVHRVFVGHVRFDRRDRGELVFGFVVRELGLEFVLPRRVGGVAHARLRLAGRLHPQQLGGQIFDRVGDGFFLLLPPLAAEHRQRGSALKPADVFLDQVDLRDGDV